MADQTKYTTKLHNTRVLVIGGSSGIGFGVAEACIENGALVVISSSNSTRIDAAVDKIKAAYPSKASRISGVPVDLSKPDTLEQELEQLFKAAVEKIGGSEGKLDHVIYTAADPLAVRKVADLTLENIVKAGQIRFFAPLLAAKFIQRYVAASPLSSYTITTGAVSERPAPNWSVIASFSGGHHSMVRNLALDLKPVRVNGVSPGVVDTELWSMGDEQKQALFAQLEKKTFTGRVGKVLDVVESYLAVLKDANMDGTMVRSDGGSTIS
jgi:NAD(P)-dependent dehydrogenase (short-subunit alcohol dehydrogenase family)